MKSKFAAWGLGLLGSFILVGLSSCSTAASSKPCKSCPECPTAVTVEKKQASSLDLKKESSASTSVSVVATVGGISITEDQVNKAAKEQMKRFESEIYDIKRKQLESMVAAKIWELEARSRGVSVGELKKTAGALSSQPASDDEVLQVYRQNAGPTAVPTDAIKERIRSYLKEKNRRDGEKTFTASLRKKYNVRVMMEPPRMNINVKDLSARGKTDAPVTIVEFSDFQCPYCSKVQTTIQELRRKYPTQVRFMFKHFPLPMHAKAKPAHVASLCAEEQGKFWEYRDTLFQSQKAIERTDLIRYGEQLGLDAGAFQQCLDSGKYESRIASDIAEGAGLGVEGTPAFFVNGRPLYGAQPTSAFEEVIEDELSKNK